MRVAADGSQVESHLAAFLPDLAVLDLGMPDISGAELIHRFRQPETTKRVLLIVVTGNHLAARSTLVEEADLILLKPVLMSDLVCFVQRLLGSPSHGWA
ncbi:MAG: response regulator [Anaerolineae bacterium]|nr:response regulator [Anaerolineae bacterium]